MLNYFKNWWFILTSKRPSLHSELLDMLENGEIHMHASPGDGVREVMFKDAFLKKGEEELIFTFKQGSLPNLFLLDALYWRDEKLKLKHFELWEWTYFKKILIERKIKAIEEHSKKK